MIVTTMRSFADGHHIGVPDRARPCGPNKFRRPLLPLCGTDTSVGSVPSGSAGGMEKARLAYPPGNAGNSTYTPVAVALSQIIAPYRREYPDVPVEERSLMKSAANRPGEEAESRNHGQLVTLWPNILRFGHYF
ncbi:hypothetical protein [Nocardia fusca]|uniref:Uncharacterized protein n=1 Tax=Nocardia fusca TaxID=941183 RepID=A0ABV3F4B7_9NOCA